MGRELASIGCLVFPLRVKEDFNNGQGANTFGRSIDLDRLPIRFHRRSPKSEALKSRTLSDGGRLFCSIENATSCLCNKNDALSGSIATIVA